MTVVERFEDVVSVDDLKTIREFVRETTSKLGATAELVDDIVLATDEAISNIIVHGYQEKSGPLIIEIEKIKGNIQISLQDQAPPFDPTQYLSQSVSNQDHIPVGGFGLRVMKQMMNELHYTALPNIGNRLVLTKRI